MKDVNCPYCNAEQDINHDDGYGYEEGRLHQQQCWSCNKYFAFTTSIHFSYDVAQADCLNGSEHQFKPTLTIPKEYTMMECPQCGELKLPTEEEMKEILNTPPAKDEPNAG